MPDVVHDLSDLGGPALVGPAPAERAARELGNGNPVAHHVTDVVVSELRDGTVGSVVHEDEAVHPRKAGGSRGARCGRGARRCSPDASGRPGGALVARLVLLARVGRVADEVGHDRRDHVQHGEGDGP